MFLLFYSRKHYRKSILGVLFGGFLVFFGGGGSNIMNFFRKVSILQGIDSLFNAYYGFRVIRITLNLKPLCCNCRYSYWYGIILKG